MSSARAVRCRLKCHNERNPLPQLPSRRGGHSAGTAAARCEEGGDDVKSARPLRPGPHTCYNGAHRGMGLRKQSRIAKPPPSSDWGLQPDPTKLDSLVIAHQPWRGEYVPGPCTSPAGRSRRPLPVSAASAAPAGALRGGLAQLARALAWHARGHRFESDILHCAFSWRDDL